MCGRGGDPGAGCRHDLRRADLLPRGRHGPRSAAAFRLPHESEPDLSRWQRIVDVVRAPEGEVRIAVVGKYTNLLDSYKSLAEALAHGGIANRVKVHLDWVDSEEFSSSRYGAAAGWRARHSGARRLRRARHRRQDRGGAVRARAQSAVLRHLLWHADGGDRGGAQPGRAAGASSTEFGPCDEPVVGLLTEWARGNEIERRAAGGDLGGTMRLGAFPADLAEGSWCARSMAAPEISERHRHRYEVNIHYRERWRRPGCGSPAVAGRGAAGDRRISGHPWFIGVQYHPELKSKPFAPHPLFAGLSPRR
jgi:CTP synthase